MRLKAGVRSAPAATFAVNRRSTDECVFGTVAHKGDSGGLVFQYTRVSSTGLPRHGTHLTSEDFSAGFLQIHPTQQELLYRITSQRQGDEASMETFVFRTFPLHGGETIVILADDYTGCIQQARDSAGANRHAGESSWLAEAQATVEAVWNGLRDDWEQASEFIESDAERYWNGIDLNLMETEITIDLGRIEAKLKFKELVKQFH